MSISLSEIPISPSAGATFPRGGCAAVDASGSSSGSISVKRTEGALNPNSSSSLTWHQSSSIVSLRILGIAKEVVEVAMSVWCVAKSRMRESSYVWRFERHTPKDIAFLWFSPLRIDSRMFASITSPFCFLSIAHETPSHRHVGVPSVASASPAPRSEVISSLQHQRKDM